MKKLALILALAALSGCAGSDDSTYHITCFSGGKTVYESEASDLWTTATLVKFHDEDGEQVILRNMECVIETNKPRYEP